MPVPIAWASACACARARARAYVRCGTLTNSSAALVTTRERSEYTATARCCRRPSSDDQEAQSAQSASDWQHLNN